MQYTHWKGAAAVLVALCIVSGTLHAQGARTNFGKKTGQVTSCKQDPDTGECIAENAEGAAKKAKPEAEAPKYPNASRVPPAFPATKIKKDWDVLAKATTGTDTNAVIAAAEAVLANPAASVNEQAEAANQIAQAYLKTNTGSYAKPIEYAEKAIGLNGLGNNSHYQLMIATGQMLLAEKRYAESLTYVERFAKETGVDDLTVNKTRGNALYRLSRYKDSIVPLKKAYELDKGADPNLAVMLMDAYNKNNQKAEADKIADDIGKAQASTDPNDASGQIKQLLVLANAKQYDKAAKLFDDLYPKGKITKANEYEAGYVSYSYVEGREEQAIKVINDGLAKNVIKPDANMYSVLGQSYYYTNNPKGAIDAWTKGAAMSSNGEISLQLAQVLGEESRYAESKAAAQQALSKGTKNRGNAYMLIAQAESEFGLNNKTAMIAALKEAEKYPETKTQAAKMLKEAGAK
jgi:hypothetical protein